MKKITIALISLFTLFNLITFANAGECINQSQNVVDEQIRNFARIKQKLVRLQCTVPDNLSSIATAIKNGAHNVMMSSPKKGSSQKPRNYIRQTANNIPSEFIHDQEYCKKVETCTDFDEIKNFESTARNIFNQKMQELTFQKSLWEQIRSGDKFCGMDEVDASCKASIKEAYNVESDEQGLAKIKGIFESVNHFKNGKWSPDAVSDENCPKFKINDVCKSYTNKISSYSSCEDDLENPGTDCYHDLQGAFFNLLRDNHKNELLYWALEQQLCRPTRIFKPIPDEAKLAHDNPNFVGPVRAPEDDPALEMIPGGSVAVDDVRDYSPNSFRSVDNFNRDSGFGFNYSKSNTRIDIDPDSNSANGKSDSVLNNFSTGLKEAYESQNNDLQKNNFVDPNTSLSNGSNFANYLNPNDTLGKNDPSNKNEETNSNAKKDEISLLNAQIDSLNKKLSEMSSKLEELKSNPKSSGDSTESDNDKLNLEKQKSILELKNKIAELENQKKELQTKQAAQIESKSNNAISSEQHRSIASYSSPIASVNDYDDKSPSQASSNQPTYTPPSSSVGNSSEFNRSPASSSANSANSISSQGGIVLRSGGVQSTGAADYSTVFLTQDEVKNYPYRLDANASDLEVEKMIKESNGAPILLGDSEQVVGVKENGKLVFKRIKVVVVKNDKDKKESISRAISSVADLKKEEDKKSRDYIRYQEMKKGLKLNK